MGWSLYKTQHKIAVLTYRVLHGGAPWYLGPLTSVGRLSPITWLCHLSDCQLSAAELFWLPPPGSGILYRSTSSRQQHSSPSRNTWKHSYFNDRTHWHFSGPRSDFGHL